MYSPLTSRRNSLIIKKLTTAEVSFSVNLTKKQRKSWWTVFHICGYDATYAKFKTL